MYYLKLFFFGLEPGLSLAEFKVSYQVIWIRSRNLDKSENKLYALDQDLSFDEILAGRPGAWLVFKKNYMHAITEFQKIPHIEIQNNFQSMFHFYDSFNGL